MLFRQNNIYSKISESNRSEESQNFCYSRDIKLYSLNNNSEKKIYYDENLKMHFESIESFSNYELEILNVSVDFDREIQKAQDFHRRLGYMYDWLQVEKSSNGKIIDVRNLEQIRRNWELLKKRIKKDYVGSLVDNYLDRISEQFAKDRHFKDIFNQYYEFGLLYFNIPMHHRENWEACRIMKIDNHEDSLLKETITLMSEDENTKKYSVKFEKDTKSSINLIEYTGEISYDKKENAVQSANIRIKYFYDESIINEWYFSLQRVLE